MTSLGKWVISPAQSRKLERNPCTVISNLPILLRTAASVISLMGLDGLTGLGKTNASGSPGHRRYASASVHNGSMLLCGFHARSGYSPDGNCNIYFGPRAPRTSPDRPGCQNGECQRFRSKTLTSGKFRHEARHLRQSSAA